MLKLKLLIKITTLCFILLVLQVKITYENEVAII